MQKKIIRSNVVNPLLQQTPFPLFSAVKPRDVMAAVAILLRRNERTVTELLRPKNGPKKGTNAATGELKKHANFTWKNLIAPLEESEDDFSKAWSIITHLRMVKNTPELRRVYAKVLPMVSRYFTAIGQNIRLYRAFLQVMQSKDYDNLEPAQRKIITETIRDFHLAGVALSKEHKKHFAKLQLRLSKLTNKFSNNVLDATYGWQYYATPAEVSGVPSDVLTAAKNAAIIAQRQSKKMKRATRAVTYLFNLDMPTYQAIMLFADSRQLRKKFAVAYATRASALRPHSKSHDNSKIIEEIIRDRVAIAAILGFNNYAEFSLATKMAKTPRQVITFLTRLARHAKKKAKIELAELTLFAKEHCGIKKLKPWDITYCSEKLRQQKYCVSQEELRPYFPLPRVLSGLFVIANKLFGLNICEVAAKKFDKWHQDVRLFAIYVGATKELRGHFYVDLYARPQKSGGAWMDSCRTRYRRTGGKLQLPIAHLVCNFAAPVGNNPTLLTPEELRTLFHEFGHCLQHLLVTADYANATNINQVPTDAVEFPSQFMEHWCCRKESLRLISGHYETGRKLPTQLIEKLQQSKNFQSGLQTLRQIEFALFDFKLHLKNKAQKFGAVYRLLKQVRQQVRVLPALKCDRMLNSFEHIFSNGYAAGYYSYLWSKMLSANAFAVFRKQGILNKTVGKSYLHNILEVGSSIEPMQAFENFCGQSPKLEALLEEDGL